ncbi:zinc finger protein 614 isoform X1 [Anolis carolinensis]|uniref:zinc finger protein 614 isoform X1 n=1 Tax=Anolis carolinensis TaxID=28377 RepID=UPI002F2B51B5
MEEAEAGLLRESLRCPLCRDLFRDPVLLSGCGHSLCRACVAQCWAPFARRLRCPHCREPLPLQGLLQPNPLLGSLAQRLRGMRAGGPAPTMAPKSAAAAATGVFGGKSGEFLENQALLGKERETQISKGKQREELLKQMEMEEQHVIWEWKELRGFLEEWEKHWLNHLEELKRDVVHGGYEQDSKVASEDSLLQELLGKQERDTSLTQSLQGVESTENSMEDGVLKVDSAVAELKQRLHRFSWKRALLQETLLQFKEQLQLEMNGDTAPGYRIESSFQSKVTSHPQEDREETSAKEIQKNASEKLLTDEKIIKEELTPFKGHSEEPWLGLPHITAALPKKIKEEEEETGISAEHITLLHGIKEEDPRQSGPEMVERTAIRLQRSEGNVSQSNQQTDGDGLRGNSVAKISGQSACTRRNYGEAAARKRKDKCYPCPECGKIFRQFGVLITHHRLHTGEKPYSCAYCAKGFSDYSNLIAHQRTHTGEKPYRCADCGKSFTRSTTLTIHQRGHTREKPYPCLQCGKRFSRASNLTIHQRTHAGERNMPYCDPE